MPVRRDPRTGRFLRREEHRSESLASQSGGEPTAEEQAREAEDAIVQEIRDNIAFHESHMQAQLQAEKEALEFELVDMWPSDARTAREAQKDETGRDLPDRPTISVNLLDQHVEQILNEAREARLALTVKPKVGLATTAIAEHTKGLVRTIQVQSGALSVRLWALQRTVRAGRGHYHIDADYANDGDYDLDLLIKRVLDQSTVAWDPYATDADQGNAEWACIFADLSVKERLRQWPDKPLRAPEGGFQAAGYEAWFNFASENAAQRSLRVACYYRVEREDRYQVFHPAHGYVWEDEADEAVKALVAAKDPDVDRRKRYRQKVVIYKCDGTQVLERTEWLGRYIPVIQTVGKEYFAQGRRRWKGTNEDARSILEAINVVLSSAVEIAGSMPTTPYVMAEGQEENHEEEWEVAGSKRMPYLLYRAIELGGKQVPPPRREQIELQIQGLMLLLRILQDFFHAVTGTVAPQLRAVNPYDRSGKAIEKLQQQGAAGSSAYLDNLATVSMPYEGKVLLDAIPKCYDRVGRIVRTTGEEGEKDTAIMLKVPFIRDEDGIPQPVPCPACEGKGRRGFIEQSVCPACEGSTLATKANMPEEYQNRTVEYVDFAEGEYQLVPSLDRSYRSEQEEALAGMTQLATAAPNLVPAYAAAWVRAMGFKGSQRVAEAIDAMYPPPGEEFEGEKVPPRVLAEFTQLKQRHDAAMQALQQAQKLIETDAIKQAGQKEIATIKAAFQEKLERVKGESRVVEATSKGSTDANLAVLKGRIDQMLQQQSEQHEVILQLLKEKGAKEVERHNAALHDAAAAAAEVRMEGREVRGEAREDLRGRSAERREEDRTVRAEDREAERTGDAERSRE